jgi:hypothetical protein
MITSYLQGGLGNQLFQVVTAYNLAKKNNDIARFNFDDCYTPHQGFESKKYKNNIFKEFSHDNNIIVENVFNQKGHSFENIPYKKNLQLQGFFQSEKFFEENKKEVVEKILIGLKSYKEKWDKVLDWIMCHTMHGQKLVSVHIRRGDYLKFPHIHTPCSLDYYRNAMSLMKESIGEFTVILVSDDKSWCLETFKDIDCVISPWDNEIEDLIMMINCYSNIIANSSFSWWGAYLNQNPNKIVIGPKRWFGIGGPQDQEDTIPKNWIKL